MPAGLGRRVARDSTTIKKASCTDCQDESNMLCNLCRGLFSMGIFEK